MQHTLQERIFANRIVEQLEARYTASRAVKNRNFIFSGRPVGMPSIKVQQFHCKGVRPCSSCRLLNPGPQFPEPNHKGSSGSLGPARSGSYDDRPPIVPSALRIITAHIYSEQQTQINQPSRPAQTNPSAADPSAGTSLRISWFSGKAGCQAPGPAMAKPTVALGATSKLDGTLTGKLWSKHHHHSKCNADRRTHRSLTSDQTTTSIITIIATKQDLEHTSTRCHHCDLRLTFW